MRGFSLPVKSPYFQMTDLREKEFTGRNITISTIMIKAFVLGYAPDSSTAGVVALLEDSAGVDTGCVNIPLTISSSDTDVTIAAGVPSAINTWCVANIGVAPDSIDWLMTVPSSLPVTPSSYQTIVTQTGTTAPAVSGSLTPTSTYPSGTTFTWARTGAGVYTLTASTAVFNTSGKTGVFVGSLNNLNAQYTVVVTSSTVITITTAVQSLAVLGLLGFTATPTDALMTKTMVYVQTYS